MNEQKTGITNFFSRQMRRFASAFKEKPTVALEDFEFEHFMLYHGLVGSSPDNQPSFKDVRADVFDALEGKSSNNMAIALKLPPLWWEERLQKIFNEANDTHPEALRACLLPDTESVELAPENDALRHPDWRVRANAAKVLAFLQLEEAIPRMITALNDDAPEAKAAFCHIASALGAIQNPQGRLALTKQLNNEENWFRVDSAAALANWPLPETIHDLTATLLQPNPLKDYVAVAISKKHQPTTFFAFTDAQVLDGACELALALVSSANGAFTPETPAELGAHHCLPEVVKVAQSEPSALRIRAALALSDWVLRQGDAIEDVDTAYDAGAGRNIALDARNYFSSDALSANVLSWLQQPEDKQTGHAILLAADFNIATGAPHMVQYLDPASPFVGEAVDALGKLGDASYAPQIVALIHKLVDLSDRTSRTLSKQPVFEDNPENAKIYWRALGALGALPHPETAQCLLQASSDFASDKRQQAITALAAVTQSSLLREKFAPQVKLKLKQALEDPSAQVRLAAVQGVARLNLAELLPEVIQLVNSKESSLARESMQAIRDLNDADSSGAVIKTLSSSVASERDRYKKQRLQELLKSIQN